MISGRRLTVVVAVAGLGLAGLSGCERDRPVAPLRPGEVMDFGSLYGQNCAGCHGADGRLGPAPPLNDPIFLALISDADLERVVGQGRAHSLMPAFDREHGGSLTPAQVAAIAKGIRGEWGAAAASAPGGLPAYRDEQAGSRQAGAQVFAGVCAQCHGAAGAGGKSGPLNAPAFLALISDQALRRIVITGRPDLGMPDYRNLRKGGVPLTADEIRDVVAYVASWRSAEIARREP